VTGQRAARAKAGNRKCVNFEAGPYRYEKVKTYLLTVQNCDARRGQASEVQR